MSSIVEQDPKPIRVVIADNQTLTRELMRSALCNAGICTVLDDVGSVQAAMASCEQLRPDLLILDMELAGYSPIDAAAEISRVSPDTKILLCAASAPNNRLLDFVRSGADGFVGKTGSLDGLLEAVRRVSCGERFFCVARTAASKEAHVVRIDNGEKIQLTPRQTEVLKLVAQGASSKKIAALLGIALKTVDTHRRDLMKRLRVRNAAGLAAYAFDMGFTGVRRPQSQPIAREQNYES